jgi:hypothetical protein
MKFVHTSDGPAPTEAEISFLEQAGHKLALGMEPGTTRRSFEVVGGAVAYLMAGTPGTVHIHTVKDTPPGELEYGSEETSVSYGPRRTPPDFLSGFVYNSGLYDYVENEETGCYVPTLKTEPVIHTEYVTTDFAAQKLCVPNATTYAIAEYPPYDKDTAMYSQAGKKRPGYFTGMMAALVQMMLGGGRFLSPSVYKQASQQRKVKNPVGGFQTAYNPTTNKRDEPLNPSHYKYMKPFVEGQCSGTSDSADPFGMEVPWDYRWHRTHGIVLGFDESVPGISRQIGFIVDIGPLGVYAYPLQVDPLTVYEKVQNYMKRVYPWMDEPAFAGNTVFGAFGGIPKPTYIIQSNLNAAVAAGKAIRLCDTDQFYSGGEFMSTMFGWAFSESTGEAINITVKGGAAGMKAAHLYKVSVKALRLVTQEEDGEKKVVVRGSATMIPVRSGNIYSPFRPPPNDPCRTTGAPQFQIYEPVIGAMISYDFRYGRAPTGKEACDAPIFCCYIKDDIHILNYVYPGESPKTTTQSATREPCQVTGSWTTTSETDSHNAGYFYNTTMDLRKQVSGGRSRETRREWAAYDYTTHAQVNFFSCAIVSEHSHYNHFSSDFEQHSGTGYAAAIGVSNTDRSVYFACTLETKTNGHKGHSSGIVYSGNGPQVRHTAMYYFISHWSGGAGAAPSIGCMEPNDEFVETVESCYSSTTESIVGKVKQYSVNADGSLSCGYYANQKVGGFYTGEGVLGLWMSIGFSPTPANDRYQEPFVDVITLTAGHEVTKKVYVFGAPLANGRMIAEYKDTAPPEDEPFGLEYAYDWFKWSIPEQCEVSSMPVCRNFFGKDFFSTYTDRSHTYIEQLGKSPGLGPTAIPVGGIMK